jgi:uncharacterized coiled-coil protein SlyX
MRGLVSALCLGAIAIQGEERLPIEETEQSLRQMRDALDEQQREIEKLQQQLRRLREPTAATSTDPAPWTIPPAPDTTQPSVATAEDVAALERRVDLLTERSKQTPLSIFNPAIGFVGETIFGYNSRANTATGFERPGGWDAYLRSAELNLEASVDPFVRGYAVINASADAATGDASVAVEEVAVVTRSLPWNLTAQVGRFFGEFGRLSSFHEHDLPFVLRPLGLENFVFGESQTDGFQVNWLAPTRHYVSLTAGTGLKFGDLQSDSGGFRSGDELNYWSRASTYFDLTPNLNLELGVSGLWAPRQDLALDQQATVNQRERQLAGVDLTVRYQPLAASLHRGLEWGTEYLFGRGHYEFDPDGAPGTGDEFARWNNAHGLYSYAAWKFNRDWSAGFLFDWTQAVEDRSAATYRYSPYVTWRPSEFQLVRLQYSHTRPNPHTGYLNDHAVYVQWSWIIGSHSHGFRQR